MRCSTMRRSSSGFRLVNVTKVPARKRQAKIVVAQGERGAHIVGQLAHEAERAGVVALPHAVEHDAFELEAPVLALLALQFHDALVAVEIDVASSMTSSAASQRQSMRSRTGLPSTVVT